MWHRKTKSSASRKNSWPFVLEDGMNRLNEKSELAAAPWFLNW